MALNIQSPFLEGLNLVLLLADDHRHLGLLHPLQLAFQLLSLLLGRALDSLLQRVDLISPVFLHQIIHTNAGDLIQADKHSLAAGPQVGVVPCEILGDALQAGGGSEEVNLLGELLLQLILLVHIQVGLLNGVQNPIRDFRVVLHVQNLLSPVFVVQRHRRAVIHGSLEIVHRYVAAEGAFCDTVAGQQRCAGKANPGGGRQKADHVVRENSVLTAVGFI